MELLILEDKSVADWQVFILALTARREGADPGTVIKAKRNMMFGGLYSWFRKSEQECVQIRVYIYIIYIDYVSHSWLKSKTFRTTLKGFVSL